VTVDTVRLSQDIDRFSIDKQFRGYSQTDKRAGDRENRPVVYGGLLQPTERLNSPEHDGAPVSPICSDCFQGMQALASLQVELGSIHGYFCSHLARSNTSSSVVTGVFR